MALSNVCVYAADLPAEIGFNDLVGSDDGFCYLTQDDKVCFIKENVITTEDGKDKYESVKIGTYFDDVMSLCEGYIDSVYFSDSDSLVGRLLIKNDGTLWGYTTNNDVPYIDQIEGIENCIKACTGGNFAIALSSDGTVYSWGSSFYGENDILDRNDPRYISYPQKIEGLSNIIDIAVSYECAYALDSDGNVYTWGENMYNTENKNNKPVEIPGIENCVEIERGYAYLLARTNDGKVYQLVDRANVDLQFPQRYYTPTLIDGVNDCIQISAGASYNEGLMLSGDRDLLYYDGSIFDIVVNGAEGREDAEMHQVLRKDFGDLLEVVSSVNDYIIKDDHSIWRIRYKDFHHELVYECAVDSDAEDKIKIDSVRFVKRSEAAGMFVKLYEELMDENYEITQENTYTDVENDSQYKSDIKKCACLGIMNGTGENSFSPNDILRREQAAVILERLLDNAGICGKLSDYNGTFKDDNKISEWAKNSVYETAALFAAEDGSYDPKEYITYDELKDIIEKVKKL